MLISNSGTTRSRFGRRGLTGGDAAQRPLAREAAGGRRAEHLAGRKAIYLARHPETAKGAAQPASMNRTLGNNVTDKLSVTSFAADTAAKVGMDEGMIRRAVARPALDRLTA